MSNLTTKVTQTSIEINGKLHLSQILRFEKITLFLFIIYSFIELKKIASLPKSFRGPHNNENTL